MRDVAKRSRFDRVTSWALDRAHGGEHASGRWP